jgi:hypothetical protein
MKTNRKTLLASLLLLSLSAATCAQEVIKIPPLPPPYPTHYDTEPPLPLPTPEQLQRGRELLKTIHRVVTQMPLTDANAPSVLKAFGFERWQIHNRPIRYPPYSKTHAVTL